MAVSRAGQGVLPLLAAAETRDCMAQDDLQEIVSLVAALGGAEVGPLSAEEGRLMALASRPSGDVQAVREAIMKGLDPIGEAICGLRPMAERRRLGAFYTPSGIVQAMVAWALDRDPVRLIDPGCGSGRFAAEATRRDPGLEVVAVDVDPLATLACRAVLATLGAKRSIVLNDDYTSVRLPPSPSLGLSAFVGNPPYVRHHRLTPDQKADAKGVAAELGIKLSGLSGLHVHFFLSTLRHARKGDIGCFITSSEWLDVGYGSALRGAS